MKILGIVGSNRRGNTYSMVEASCNSINDYDVELIHLRDYKISFCDGCLCCDTKGKCHINDDMQILIEKIKKADGFILGTPARWGLMSGELKTFLDRLNPLAVPELLNGKKAILFSIGQSTEEDLSSIENALTSLEYFCNNAGIEVIDKLLISDCLGSNDLIKKKQEAIKHCSEFTKKLVESLDYSSHV